MTSKLSDEDFNTLKPWKKKKEKEKSKFVLDFCHMFPLLGIVIQHQYMKRHLFIQGIISSNPIASF